MIERVGNYRIVDEIASGGMAVVYKGVQEALNRTVAIKALKTEMAGQEQMLARFEREATSVASFQHENLLTVYDFIRAYGSLFIVMEYVEGIDVYDLLEKHERIPPHIAAIIAMNVARALEYAHFRGVIHRDVKPANIILSKSGEVKLTDFGIAKVEDQRDLTEAGLGVGTPSYMSPEQVVGDRLDHRSDIWSLGVVLYQMVTGTKPFADDDHRTVAQRVRLERPKLPHRINSEINQDLERIILTCMEKDREDRYASAQDLIVAVEQYLAIYVATNYRAKLVHYLKSEGIISSDETSALLHPALIGDVSSSRTRFRVPRRTRRSLLMWGLPVVIVAFLAGLLLQRTSDSETVAQGQGTDCAACVMERPEPQGFLRVLAHPWARVEVDGKVRATTPIDHPLKLDAGFHRLRLLNPYFESHEQRIKITANKVLTVTAALKRTEQPTQGKGN